MEESLLIEHLAEYYAEKDTRNFTVLDFVGAYGSPLLAIAYSKLFWASFEEFKGMIFLSDNFDKNKKEKIGELLEKGQTLQEIEKSFNWFEIPSGIFSKNAGDTYDEEDCYLAKTLVQTWSCKLEKDFPNKSFCVKILSPEETGGEIGIVFYQKTTT